MKKYILLFLFILTVAACRPISRGPNPYQAPSPLAVAMPSPLYSRGAAPAIDMPGGLIAPNDYRAGTIPSLVQNSCKISPSLVQVCYKLYLPIMAGHQTYPCYTNGMSAELMRLMITDRVQQRINPHCNELVTKVAQARADDMVTNEYFSHRDLRGHGANWYLAQVGCLPSWYPADGNSVESITLNYHTAQAAWNALVSSKGHRPHVLGMHPFFAGQNAVGVGWAKSDWGVVFVVISTEGCN
jgi:hypothetical protein